MGMKEKLVELVHNARMNALWHNAQKPDEYITDMLMEDGVTVQEWISVKDRLPERYKYVILWDAMDGDIFMGVLDDKREWYVPGYQGEPFHITHWMPLPQPPKGE